MKRQLLRAAELMVAKQPAAAQHAVDTALDTMLDALIGSDPERAGDFVWSEFFPFILMSRMGYRAWAKPRGYPGDYKTIDLVYENRPKGWGLLGTAVDRWLLSQDMVQAVRNRRILLADMIKDVTTERLGARTRVTSLASGPAREVIDVLQSQAHAPTITCADIDPAAIDYAAALAADAQVAHNLRFEQVNLLHVIGRRAELDLAPQHLIYSMGLIDYFDDNTVVALLDWIHARLARGGLVAVGNMAAGARFAPVLKELVGWPITFRSPTDIRSLFAKSRFGGRTVDVTADATGVQLIATAARVDVKEAA